MRLLGAGRSAGGGSLCSYTGLRCSCEKQPCLSKSGVHAHELRKSLLERWSSSSSGRIKRLDSNWNCWWYLGGSSALPKNTKALEFRCKSKEDDLEIHKLRSGQSWNFSFHENTIRSTLFYCNFRWGSK
uniref:S-protein homolog n=1 Tax=Nicotiana sylvestris TaxID=4096 RepID=A0A1U7W9C2_NICSY|nr:PREDICTED: uncharacterized protein LOC104225164 [Nicotiana sylvestris]